MTRPVAPIAALSCLLLLAIGTEPARTSPTRTTDPGSPTPGPLEPFEHFVGGAWHLGDAYQVFEWGLDGRWVRARSFAVTAGGRTELVGEAVWFHHPGEDRIRGYGVARAMPVSFFDYTTRFVNGSLVSDLVAFDEEGRADRYREIWTPRGEDRFEWALLDEEGNRLMEGVYERRALPASEPALQEGGPGGGGS